MLRGAGFDPRSATAVARSALWTGIMLVMSEPGYHPELSGDERAETIRRDQIQLAMLPAATFPRLVECAERVMTRSTTTALASSCSSPGFTPSPTGSPGPS